MSQRIIAVDDSDIAQEFIRATLAELGFQNVVGFMNPHEALDAIQEGRAAADLILLDIMMPEMDGIELCARIRGIESWGDVPIIMLTSRKDMESLSLAFMAGANDYVTKPFDRIELQARMRSCLRLKSELDRRRATERRAPRDKSLPGPSGKTAQAYDLIGTRYGLHADLLSLSAENLAKLMLIVFKIDNIQPESDITEPLRGDMIRQVAQVLGRVTMRASDRLAHWEDDLFCLALIDATEVDARAEAGKFREAISMAGLYLPDTWSKRPVTLSAAIVRVGEATVAASLASAVQAVEAASQRGDANVVTVQSTEKEQ